MIGERRVELASATALWYHTGLPPVPLRWVLIRDPQGRFATQEFATLCGAGAEPADLRAATGGAVQITRPATGCSFGVE